MKTIRVLLLFFLYVSTAFASMTRDWVASLDMGWQERRNNLLWWREDISRADSNGVFYPGYKQDMDERLKQAGDSLLDELAKQEGSDSNVVTSALERLARGGTFEVTNVLQKALALGPDDTRFQTLRACINVWSPDMSGLAASVVSRVPPETLVAWERVLAEFLAKGVGKRDSERIRLFLGYLPLAETESSRAAMYDRLKLQVDSEWRSSNSRKCLVANLLASGQDTDGYFGRVSGEIGPPLYPSAEEVLRLIEHAEAVWPDRVRTAGPRPDTWVAEVHQVFYETALARFGMTKLELLRMIADRFESFQRESSNTYQNRSQWFRYVAALEYGADPVAANALLRAIESDWIPESVHFTGAEALDRALRKCIPGWGNGEERERFIEKARIKVEQERERQETMIRQRKREQEQRLLLLWWRPDDTSVSTNGAPEVARKRAQGSIHVFAEELKRLTTLPDGGADTVSAVAKRLTQCGTYDVTNNLSQILFDPTSHFRFLTFAACVSAWQPDMSGLAGAIVLRIPPEMRAEWYDLLAKTNWTGYALWRSPRMEIRKSVFLRFASRSETDASGAVAIDRALTILDPAWQLSNQRRKLAHRFKDAEAESGKHFRQVVAETGPFHSPGPHDIDDLASQSLLYWPDDHNHYLGGKPEECDAENYQIKFQQASVEFGVTEQELTNMIGNQFTSFWQKGERAQNDSSLWFRYVSALKYGNSPVTISTLRKASKEAWLPNMGGEFLDSALLALDSEWEFCEDRKCFATRVLEQFPEGSRDFLYFREILQKIGAPRDTGEKK